MIRNISESLQFIKVLLPITPDSNDSDVFYVEQSSGEQSPPRTNTPIVLNSRVLSGIHTRGMIIISSVTSPEPNIITIESDTNEPTMPFGFGWELPKITPSLNDLNLPPDLFNILAKMVVVEPTALRHDKTFCLQSPEPSDPSATSTPPMNLSTIESWDTSSDEDIFRFRGRALKKLSAINSSPSATTRKQKKTQYWNVLSKKRRSVAAILRTLRSDAPSSRRQPRPV